MDRRTVLTLVSITLVATLTVECRSRRTPTPRTNPSSAVTDTQTVVPVPSTEREFQAPSETAGTSQSLAEINRRAHSEGWLRDAFFGFDSSTLDTDARAALSASATWLRGNPRYRIQIEGHCDERGTEQYNLALGERRAAAAAEYLIALGVDDARISTVSYGEERPFEEGSGEAVWAQNRRAHLVVSRAD